MYFAVPDGCFFAGLLSVPIWDALIGYDISLFYMWVIIAELTNLVDHVLLQTICSVHFQFQYYNRSLCITLYPLIVESGTYCHDPPVL